VRTARQPAAGSGQVQVADEIMGGWCVLLDRSMKCVITMFATGGAGRERRCKLHRQTPFLRNSINPTQRPLNRAYEMEKIHYGMM